MIDLTTVQNSCNKMEIKDAAYIWLKYNITDALAKVMEQSILINRTEKFNERLIIRCNDEFCDQTKSIYCLSIYDVANM